MTHNQYIAKSLMYLPPLPSPADVSDELPIRDISRSPVSASSILVLSLQFPVSTWCTYTQEATATGRILAWELSHTLV